MNEDQVRQVVREAVQETLLGLGIAHQEPYEMQADFIYIRRMRKGSEFISQRVITSLVTVTIPTALYLMWESIKQLLGR